MNITWYNEKPKDCIVTIGNGSLTLNKPAVTFFENAYSVMLGQNTDDKLIFIKPLNKQRAMMHDLPENSKYRITIRSSYGRITNKAFLKEVVEWFNLDVIENVLKFKAVWDPKNEILVVDLKEVV
ncbi:hypothetical protein KHQ89_04855 [Mycoplasmatota bacterium]|nr:hypothetical protein KHQ89_04855 [Mycoplasmatota bacterium]